MDSLINLSIVDFLELTASDAPVPGGGSVAALSGALAASLATMVARLTLGRKKYADAEPLMVEAIERLAPAIERLTAAIDLDSAAYGAVMEAFRLPRDTDADRAARSAAIERATVEAARVPLDTARAVVDILPQIEVVAARGNVNAVTDAAVAALAADTAVTAATLNVRVNLPGIADKELAGAMAAECARLVEAAAATRRRVLEHVNNTLN